MSNIPEYINIFLVNNKEQLDKIYNEHIEKNFGILNINIDTDTNKVDVFFINEEQLRLKQSEEFVNSIIGHNIFQIYDKSSRNIYIINNGSEEMIDKIEDINKIDDIEDINKIDKIEDIEIIHTDDQVQ